MSGLPRTLEFTPRLFTILKHEKFYEYSVSGFFFYRPKAVTNPKWKQAKVVIVYD